MNEIRAFVGHSFNESDKEVVDKFLKYFDQVSSLFPSFSWAHAELAEPKILAAKVMELISDKNVFIAICTKKECVVDPSNLKNNFFPRGALYASKNHIEFKTSDWVIQEIGLAFGRGLTIILLVENGLRSPGGLQGNLEYINFDRESPEKSFGKVLEMIKACSPRAPNTASATTGTQPTTENSQKNEEPLSGANWTVPNPSWTIENFKHAFTYLAMIDNKVAADSINDAYLSSKDATLGTNLADWSAFVEFWRIRFAMDGSLEKLKALAKDNPENAVVLDYLAQSLEHYEDYKNASSLYEEAASKTQGGDKQIKLLGEAVIAHTHAGEIKTAIALLDRIKGQVQSSGQNEKSLLKTLRKLTELNKQDEEHVATLERIVELDPSDLDTRFQLALKHSNIGNNDLALFHYLRIPAQERSQMVWNNLGVAYGSFDLAALSVDAYRKAEGMGETLAMSNLANQFISSGFLAEAEALCESARKFKDYHDNIDGTLARLKRLPDTEKSKVEEIINKAKPIVEFYEKFGRAVSSVSHNDLADTWEGPDCTLHIETKEGFLIAKGSYEQKASGLSAFGGLFGLGGPATGTTPPVRYNVEYRGAIHGKAVDARVSRVRDGQPSTRSSLLSDLADENKALMVLSIDGSEIHVMERSKEGFPRFYKFKCKI